MSKKDCDKLYDKRFNKFSQPIHELLSMIETRELEIAELNKALVEIHAICLQPIYGYKSVRKICKIIKKVADVGGRR